MADEPIDRRHRLTVREVDPALIVEADRQILSSIICNLLDNAFTYTRSHSHVWLHTHATADRALFEVEDQCGGISPVELARLLEPCASRGNEPSELGAGLAICVRGAEALHGEIRVRNQNNGCVFTVDLPRAQD